MKTILALMFSILLAPALQAQQAPPYFLREEMQWVRVGVSSVTDTRMVMWTQNSAAMPLFDRELSPTQIWDYHLVNMNRNGTVHGYADYDMWQHWVQIVEFGGRLHGIIGTREDTFRSGEDTYPLQNGALLHLLYNEDMSVEKLTPLALPNEGGNVWWVNEFARGAEALYSLALHQGPVEVGGTSFFGGEAPGQRSSTLIRMDGGGNLTVKPMATGLNHHTTMVTAGEILYCVTDFHDSISVSGQMHYTPDTIYRDGLVISAYDGETLDHLWSRLAWSYSSDAPTVLIGRENGDLIMGGVLPLRLYTPVDSSKYYGYVNRIISMDTAGRINWEIHYPTAGNLRLNEAYVADDKLIVSLHHEADLYWGVGDLTPFNGNGAITNPVIAMYDIQTGAYIKRYEATGFDDADIRIGGLHNDTLWLTGKFRGDLHFMGYQDKGYGVNVVAFILPVSMRDFVGISEHQSLQKSALIAWPNPTADNLHILLPDNTGPVQFTIFDALGKVAMRTQFTGQESVLSIAHFPPGIYHLKAVGEQLSSMGKVVKR